MTITGGFYWIPGVVDPADTRSISVHWMGLFDAVSEIGSSVRAANTPRAKTFSLNVVSHSHLIKRATGGLHKHFPTRLGFAPTTVGGWTHGDVGKILQARNMMINNARAAGVPVR